MSRNCRISCSGSLECLLLIPRATSNHGPLEGIFGILENTIHKTFGEKASHALKISMESTHIVPSNAVGAVLALDRSLVQLHPSRRAGSLPNAVDTFGPEEGRMSAEFIVVFRRHSNRGRNLQPKDLLNMGVKRKD